MNDDCASTTEKEQKRQEKRERLLAYKREYMRNRYKTDPAFVEQRRIYDRERRASEEARERKRKYMREYKRKRYQNDAEFAKKVRAKARDLRQKNLDKERARTREYMREQRRNKPDEVRAKEREYYAKNSEKRLRQSKERYKKLSKETIRKAWERERQRMESDPMFRQKKLERISKYTKNRKRKDPAFAVAITLRARIGNVLRHKGTLKSNSTLVLLGCSKEHMVRHIERQFQKGMTWENRGSLWHIDHIIPLSSFDLTTEAGQRACCHYSNLRPMWASENIRKRAKIITCQPELPLPLL